MAAAFGWYYASNSWSFVGLPPDPTFIEKLTELFGTITVPSAATDLDETSRTEPLLAMRLQHMKPTTAATEISTTITTIRATIALSEPLPLDSVCTTSTTLSCVTT